MSSFEDYITSGCKKVTIFFGGSISAIKEFVNRANKYDNLEIIVGRWCVDARSIMGLLSLDLSNPVTLVYPENREDDIFMDFGGYIVAS